MGPLTPSPSPPPNPMLRACNADHTKIISDTVHVYMYRKAEFESKSTFSSVSRSPLFTKMINFEQVLYVWCKYICWVKIKQTNELAEYFEPQIFWEANNFQYSSKINFKVALFQCLKKLLVIVLELILAFCKNSYKRKKSTLSRTAKKPLAYFSDTRTSLQDTRTITHGTPTN